MVCVACAAASRRSAFSPSRTCARQICLLPRSCVSGDLPCCMRWRRDHVTECRHAEGHLHARAHRQVRHPNPHHELNAECKLTIQLRDTPAMFFWNRQYVSAPRISTLNHRLVIANSLTAPSARYKLPPTYSPWTINERLGLHTNRSRGAVNAGASLFDY